MEKEIKIVIKDEWVARVIQRLLTTEINNQRQWSCDDMRNGIDNKAMRSEVISAMKELQEQLEKQGIAKHIQCF